ncbi:MAG: hypothetical protein K0R67_3565, partial [Paenibacillus sp.]|nr:hypothetical protein [Paenibacillus sp.]
SLQGHSLTFTATASQLTVSADSLTVKPNEYVYVNIALSNLIDTNALYGAEVHIQYNDKLNFNPVSGTDPGYNDNQIFNSGSSVANLTQYPANGDDTKEIVYTISKYPSAENGTSGIDVSGTKRLIQIPLKAIAYFGGTGTSDGQLRLEIMLVNKDGDIIYESSIPVIVNIVFDGGVLPPA